MSFPDLVPRGQNMAPVEVKNAIEVENAYKSYIGEDLVLNNLNMTVPTGTIYGLLGASGCGKTTILSCLVALRKLDSGNIRVFGCKPGEKGSGIPGGGVAMMPQDIALYQIFSIKETLTYYGKIYGMNNAQIKERIAFLSTFLELPDSDSLIQNLSGGQSRRTSLAVSLFHEPRLLILDEPTAGVDPTLRESIWSHLIDIVRTKGTTCIITTHYCQDAERADIVGLMRHGRLLVEDHPDNLIKQHNNLRLDDIVLNLCRNDRMNFINSTENYKDNDSEDKKDTKTQHIASPFTKPDPLTIPTIGTNVIGIKYKARSPDYNTLNFPSITNGNSNDHTNGLERVSCSPNWDMQTKYSDSPLKKISALVTGHHLNMVRHPVFLSIQIFLPVIQIFLFNFILGTEPVNTKFGVVNNELANNTDFQQFCMHRVDACFAEGLSCNYLKLFEDGSIIWVPMDTEDEALESVQNGYIVGYISIPANFTSHMRDKFLERNFAENATLDGSTISTRMDLSNKIISGLLIKSIYNRYLEFLQNVAKQCGADPNLLKLPLKYGSVFDNTVKDLADKDIEIEPEGNWSEFFQPAFVIWTIFLLPMGSSVAMIMDKREGLLDRSIVAGVKFPEIIIARLVYESFITIMQLSLCFVILIFVFGLYVKGTLILFIIISFFVGVTGLSFAFLFGGLCSSPLEAIMGILFIFLYSNSACGGAWPAAAVSPWLRSVFQIFPVTVPLEALRSVLSRGWTLQNPVVWQSFIVMFSWISFNCIASGILHRMKH